MLQIHIVDYLWLNQWREHMVNYSINESTILNGSLIYWVCLFFYLNVYPLT
jgi:hypothetical protein